MKDQSLIILLGERPCTIDHIDNYWSLFFTLFPVQFPFLGLEISGAGQHLKLLLHNFWRSDRIQYFIITYKKIYFFFMNAFQASFTF